MESLKVSNLCKTYIVNKRQNNVLRNVNLEIKSGEMVAVMGHLAQEKQHYYIQLVGWMKPVLGKLISLEKS